MPKKTKATKSNVKHLREAIGKHFGQKSVGRDYFAKLIGASPGSVVLWEKGKAPSDKFTPKLSEIAKKVSAGDFKGFPIPPKRGRQAGRKAKKTGAKRAKRAKAVRQTAPKNGRWSATELANALLEFAIDAKDRKPLLEAARVLLQS
jgi:hypothetical protein